MWMIPFSFFGIWVYSSATTHDVSAAPAPRPPEAMNMSDEEFDGVP